MSAPYSPQVFVTTLWRLTAYHLHTRGTVCVLHAFLGFPDSHPTELEVEGLMQAGPVAEDQKVEEEEIIEATEACVLHNVGGYLLLLAP